MQKDLLLQNPPPTPRKTDCKHHLYYKNSIFRGPVETCPTCPVRKRKLIFGVDMKEDHKNEEVVMERIKEQPIYSTLKICLEFELFGEGFTVLLAL
ncbi:uncharacterized protein LOC132172477 isoform X2 [Corylus avellana]|uniref:uncharacterized protein LOC132172477 isoform X2 n=1 Tax=Corylus avellana TaxID=13451 RepID=UPI00286CB61B|nr:uncharacterized protein LOC132172477 isoform X2 [Corylus avellana]